MIAAALVLAAAVAARPDEVAVSAAATRARYVAAREPRVRGLVLPSHEAFGWSQRARLLADGSTEITVVSQPIGARAVAGSASPPPDAARTLDRAATIPDEVRRLSEEIVDGSADAWESSERVVTWVSLNVRHVDAPAHDDGSLATLMSREASCVGRSRLAADLLVAAGIPARTVHGLLAQPAGSPSPFLLHRFIETWIDGLGWVPSDPGESVHGVDARHVFVQADSSEYDPESQRGLLLRAAEPAVLSRLAPAGMRALMVADRPALLRAGAAP